MRALHYIFTLCLLVITVNGLLVPENPIFKCLKNSVECAYSWECCSGCCNEGRCENKSETCRQDIHPCASQTCPVGTSSQLEPVQCIRPPCPPIAVCREYANPCQNFTCNPGTHCELILPPTLPKYCTIPSSCIPKPFCAKDLSSCDEKSCPYGSVCYLGNQPECVASCDQFDCAIGFKCTVERFECSHGLCEIRPTCLPSCEGVECPVGRVCRVKEVECASVKCPARADCFITCAGIECPADQICDLNTGECAKPITPRPPFPQCY